MSYQFFVAILMALSPPLAQAQPEFPPGCVLDNFDQICENLKKIKNTDKIVFADGTEMPACLLENADKASEQKEFEQAERALIYKIKQEVDSKGMFTRSYIVSSSLVERLKDLEKYSVDLGDEQFSKDVATYLNLTKRRKISEQKKKFDSSIKKDFKFARTEILDLLYDLKKEADSSEIQSAIDVVKNKVKLKVYPGEQDLCAPDTSNIGNDSAISEVIYTAPSTLYPSLAQLRILGHEIAHSFDPCRVKVDSIDRNPFKNLISCLRDDVGQFRNSLKTPETAGDWCVERHTNEAFCDYVGAYVVEQKLKKSPPTYPARTKLNEDGAVYLPSGYEYLIHDLDTHCAKTSEKNNDRHPSHSRRIRDIILKSPGIAKLAGCDASTELRCEIKTGLVKPQAPSTKDTKDVPAAK